MGLSSGQRLGPYEILAPIGAGGMGEVYRAVDPRIGRQVAVKVLPPAFAQDEGRLARFEQEARSAGVLNHPGILNVYDVGQDQGVHYLVTELLEGETLRAKLGSPLPQRKVVDYALQIARALAAAHDRGIVHRDMKPENLFVTNDGRVKILDFGLAKLTQPDPAADVSKMQTGAPESIPGTILGTVGYMSPEQVRGKGSDHRSDIFAFGLILYEMITGRRAFHGETPADTMSAILSKEPPELSGSNPNLSPAMSRIVEHCMEKSVEQRFQSMHDVAFYLDTLSGVSSSTSVTAPAHVSQRFSIRASLPWMVSVLMTLVAAALWLGRQSQKTTQPETLHVTIPLLADQRTATNAYGAVAISPDGKTIVYTGVEDQIRLYRRDLNTFESRVIEGTEGGHTPFFSPDGKWLAFFTAHEMKKMLLSGGSPVTICRLANSRGGSWGENGMIVYSPFFYAGLNKISADGGTPQPLTHLDREKGERNHRWPFMLPGGKAALFTIGVKGRWSEARIGAVRLDTGEQKIVLEGGFGARYLPTGHMIFGRGDSLYAIRFDPETLQTHGDPVRLVDGVADSSAGTLEYAFSDNGTLVTLPAGRTFHEAGFLTQLNRKGEKIPFAQESMNSIVLSDPRISPDNRWVAGDRDFEIWIYDLERGTPTRLTSGARTAYPIWTRDGKRITYVSEALGFWCPFWRAADGSDQEKPVYKSDLILNPWDWSPDGSELLAWRDTEANNADAVVINPTTGKLREIAATPAVEISPIFSPDGKWIAYPSDESGRLEIYVRSNGGPDGRWQVSTDGGTNVIWKRQDEILYTAGDRILRVPVQTTPTFSAGAPELLFQTRFLQIDATSDHERFIAVVPETKNKQDLMNIVTNWFDEVRRRVPASR